MNNTIKHFIDGRPGGESEAFRVLPSILKRLRSFWSISAKRFFIKITSVIDKKGSFLEGSSPGITDPHLLMVFSEARFYAPPPPASGGKAGGFFNIMVDGGIKNLSGRFLAQLVEKQKKYKKLPGCIRRITEVVQDITSLSVVNSERFYNCIGKLSFMFSPFQIKSFLLEYT